MNGASSTRQRPQVRLAESYWPADDSEPLLDLSLGEMIQRIAREVPDRVALVEGVDDPARRRRWTYAQLARSGETVARALLRRFVPGERIAVWSPNSAEWILLQHGAALAGLVLVTVNPAFLASELEHVLKTSRAAGVFHTDRYRDNDMRAILGSIRSRLPDLRDSVSFDDWDAFVATSDPSLVLPGVRAGDMVQIQFTSGTTGVPKGACLHHRGIINAARFTAMRVGFPEGGVWLTAMPLFHVGGCAGSELGAMSHRGTFVLAPAFEAGTMLELIETERVDHMHAVPAMVLAMLDHPSRASRDLASLKTMMTGGSNVPAALIRRACETFGARATITYGQTELNGVICQTRPDDTPERQSATIGQCGKRMEMKIADPETGRVLPLGEPGEIWARGFQNMLGYINVPEGGEAALTDDGWLKTGDLATMDESGYLRITGRLKDCIIRGGENIYPREVEDVLLAHPAVRQVSVVGVPDERMGEAVAAVIQLRPGHRGEALDFFRWCRARLAAYKTPVHWYYVDEYPLTPSGKIRKFVLRDMIADGSLKPEPFVKPSAARRPDPVAP